MNTHTHTQGLCIVSFKNNIYRDTCALCIDPAQLSAHYVLIVYIKVLMRWKLKSNLYNAFLRGV